MRTPLGGRIFAFSYPLSFGVSACAVPLAAFMHEHGGFAMLFRVLFGLLVLLGALFFPYRRDELTRFTPAAQAAE